MKLIKDKQFLSKLLRDILNVIYWFTIIGTGFLLLSISWMFFIGETNTAKMLLTIQQGFPVRLNISDIGKLVIDNLSYEVLIFQGEAMVLVKNPPFGLLIFNMLIYIINIGVFIYIINLLRKILKNISNGKQFNNKNEIYIRNIGLIIIIGSIFRAIVDISLRIYLSSNLLSENFKVITNIDLSSFFTVLFLGFVILVISQIFKLGTEIKSEQDLTI